MLRVVITKNHMVCDCINMNAQNKANLYKVDQRIPGERQAEQEGRGWQEAANRGKVYLGSSKISI